MEKNPFQKNDVLAESFLSKSENLSDPNQRIKCLSNAMLFASENIIEEIILKRNNVQARKKQKDLEKSNLKVDNTMKFHETLKNFSDKVTVQKQSGRGR